MHEPDDHASPSFEEVLTEWLFQHAYQLNGTLRVGGVSDPGVRREVVESYLWTLAGSFAPEEFRVAVQSDWLDTPSQEFWAELRFTTADVKIHDDGSCDFRFCAQAALDRLD